MALTESVMLALGTSAPDFSLPSTEGHIVSLDDFKHKKLLVVIFMCNHCPYVKHIATALAQVASEYSAKNVGFVGISSNDVEAYPEDSLEKMKQEKIEREYTFPYLLDETQEVALVYNAACTPDFFVFDENRALAYRGQFDDTRPSRIASGQYDFSGNLASGSDLKAALDTLLAGNDLTGTQYPAMGCNIKWKPGNEPIN
ncbi:thioredoxin family protein [Teredinibacter sp. KSP-S5-2]|uniref:thioredoxin family protein n=1 Tax=Teredinibacter sp. KSP-S5-2 TaxID=3034506 RepID=UPI0029352994|nr:thioredoxin family protein [Teredinibacter sp. KSP-S5-2]WNO09416.1 thioredoxin family protein [Teredinibacter sp. KSP-S5-2]